ncbi:beta-galactosidase BglA [Oryzibacter oryziterrae]|uniref:beta-galactosidase BglA n=1 Tax=Oryzibacter oryziterrae TaxID=2766474 RepID=UPI001F34FCAF|nr:alpha-glucosidase [Oryzibacter oryziterrae]
MNQHVTAPIKTDRASNPDWWRGAVIYQVYPRSFQDTNGDGIGDLAGVTARIDYLQELGIDAIWLSPFFTSPMKDFGYDVSDYCDVDPIFGNLKDFDDLIAAAHARGIKIIIDQVISHTSDQHPWFKESRSSKDNPKADWYVWAEAAPDGTAPNNWLSVFGGPAWEWDSRRCQFFMHNFLASQPDLNFHNPDVQDALLGVLKFWLDRGVDGFRLDTVNYYFHDAKLRNNPAMRRKPSANDAPLVNPYGRQKHLYDKTQPENVAFLARMRALLNQYPGTTTIGEVGDGERSLETMAAYTAGGDKLHMCYTFDLLGGEYSRDFFERTMKTFEARAGDGWPCWAYSNHDVKRHASRFLDKTQDPVRQAKLLATLLMSLRGSVCLYEGEELGLTEADLAFEDLVDPYGIRFWPEFKGRDGCRTPMVWSADAPFGGFSSAKPWLPVPDEHKTRAVDQQQGVPGSVFEHYRAMIAFRKTRPALISGSISFLPTRGDLLAFVRQAGASKMLVVVNFAQKRARFTLPADVKVATAADLGFGASLKGDVIKLGPEDLFIADLA